VPFCLVIQAGSLRSFVKRIASVKVLLL
jgi:hypothetical protein